jgi:hypothetical protein
MGGFLSIAGLVFGGIGNFAMQILTGDSLKSILKTIDSGFDNETERERIKGEVTKTWIEAQAKTVQRRTWWFQLFFVIPLGVYFSACVFDAITHVHYTDPLLPPLDSWAGWIISALFVVDGGKALIDGFKK